MIDATETSTGSARLDHVSFRYPDRDEAVLRDVQWTVPEGAYVVVAGVSGSGKSTLLRCLNGLVPHFSGGRFGGSVSVRGLDTRTYGPRALSRSVGFVFQDPESQLVTNRVEDELAFGMEQLGVPPLTMRKRVEEVLDLLGIAPLRYRDPTTLSGGERQRVAVAAALAIQPQILVLDEPTSQLDPWGAEDVLTALTRLNEDLGLTVVLAEHRLERVIGHADRLRVIDRGETLEGTPREVLSLCDTALAPPLVRLGRALGWSPLPLTIKEGRAIAADSRRPRSPDPYPTRPGGPPVVELRQVSAAYGKRAVLREVDLDVRPGELVALMGRNGSGKTTLLRSIIGFHRPSSGRILVAGRDATRGEPADLAADVGYLPQRPTSLLFRESVHDELAFTLKHHRRAGLDPDQLLAELDLNHLADRHPRDLSAGEQERVALAAILVAAPRVLLLDEPTRGMDYLRKRALATLLHRLRNGGTAIIVATHDVEFVAELATRVVLLGDGEVVADGSPREVLSGSLTFATQINKLYGDGFLTVEDALLGAVV
ncbi:MAG: energy-coupling factor transport system ATP-binding protein [Thermomicrobiales bacterium]|nr:energy-coupling factor transport system ATP-binding protein [Thermomicrobiales bacterium]